MSKVLEEFKVRLRNSWLPAFCNAPHRNYPLEGFNVESIMNLAEFDAKWFLEGVKSEYIRERDGFFFTTKSRAKEQIFRAGLKKIKPRPISLWIEPIVTVGAVSRLNIEFNWPEYQLGMQSKTWAFDLVGYDEKGSEELLLGEVKKNHKEVDDLILYMKEYCSMPTLIEEPVNSRRKNAYRKVVGLREAPAAQVLWVLGPQRKRVCI